MRLINPRICRYLFKRFILTFPTWLVELNFSSNQESSQFYFFFVCFCLFLFLILLIKVRKITPDRKNLRFCNTHWLEEEHYNLIKKDAFQKLYQFAKRNNQFKGENISCNNLWQNINLPELKRFVSIWNKYFSLAAQSS